MLSEVKSHYGKLKNYINGEWVESKNNQMLEVMEVKNPATGEVIAEAPMSTRDDVDAAVAAAREAWWSWRETPPMTRAGTLFNMKYLMEEHFEDIARIIVQENGKTIDEARGETRRAIENVEVACGITTLQMGYGLEDGAGAGIDEEAIRQPLGVFAAICPFNFPAMIPFWFWPYAVACGNTYIIKPSKQVPITMQYVFDLIDKAGFPPGVINLINGSHDVADALMDHPDIKGISFVGSTPVAHHVYKKSAENGRRVQAQGGAKNSLVVMPDCALDRAIINMLSSCYGCAGQRCLAGSNILVVGDIYNAFKEKFLEGARRIKVGYGLDETANMGPLVSLDARSKVTGYIDRGAGEGAKLLLDGRGIQIDGYPKGAFVGPTIFEEVTQDMTIAKEEIFGPVVSLIRVADLDEAINFIHSSPFGNAATIYTQSGAAAREFRYSVQCGNIGINVGIAAPVAYFPFSGYKSSFFGDLHAQGFDSINFFTERKVVITRWF